MKRMVENSEKIEELADAVEVDNDNVKFNGGLTTSNITAIDGTKIDIISEDMYYIYGDIPTYVFNLGTALIIQGSFAVDTHDGTFKFAYIDKPSNDSKISAIKISGGRETTIQITNDPVINNRLIISIVFDSQNAAVAYKDYFEITILVSQYTREV